MGVIHIGFLSSKTGKTGGQPGTASNYFVDGNSHSYLTPAILRKEKRRFRVREGWGLSSYREPLHRTRRSVCE